MAAITPVSSQIKIGTMKIGHKFFWETLTSTNTTGIGIRNPIEGDKTVQATGSFSGSASLGVQGSNDSTDGADGTWFPLEDTGGTDLAFTAAGGDVIKENPDWIRPVLASGDGSADVDVTIVSRP